MRGILKIHLLNSKEGTSNFVNWNVFATVLFISDIFLSDISRHSWKETMSEQNVETEWYSEIT